MAQMAWFFGSNPKIKFWGHLFFQKKIIETNRLMFFWRFWPWVTLPLSECYKFQNYVTRGPISLFKIREAVKNVLADFFR